MDELRQRVERAVRQVVRELLTAEGSGLGLPAEDGPRRRPLVAANWKMNGSRRFVSDYAARLEPAAGVEVLLCPPAALLVPLAESLGPASAVVLGAQDIHPEPAGAYTGAHGPALLADAGASWVIVGHSERRGLFGEDDALVAAKLRAALSAGLGPILCIGERLAEREAGATFRVLRAQLTAALAGLGSPWPEPARLVVAYEPVWAIGSGRNASAAQVQEAMAFVRQRLAELFSFAFAERVRLLYGGSANPANTAELAALADVDGFLVGGAGLDPGKFSQMLAQTARAKAAGAHAELRS